MKTYELSYIISPGISSQDSDNLSKEIEDSIQSRNGVILKSEKSQPRMLSYTIKGHPSGYFGIMEFQIKEENVKEVKDVLDKNTNILRSLIVVKKPLKIKKQRRSLANKPEFDFRRKTRITAPFTSKENKEEKVNTVDLNKKLDELLS